MWQRIQSVFLVLVAVSMIATIFFPVWVHFSPEGKVTAELYPLHYTTFSDSGPVTAYLPYSLMAVLAITSATLAIIAVRRFDDRLVQMKLGALNSLVMAGMVVAAALFANHIAREFETDWKYDIGFYMPMAGVFFNFLANRFIRRDEKRVRDADRIR